MTRGATERRSSGPPRARRPATTSRRCLASGPSAPRSTCTTPSPQRVSRLSPTRAPSSRSWARPTWPDPRSPPPAPRSVRTDPDARRDQALPLPVRLLRPGRAHVRLLVQVGGADRRHRAGPHRPAVRAHRLLPLDDRQEAAAAIEDAEGNYGYFVASSWTPLWLAGSGAIMFAGLAIGWWLFIIGAVFAVVAVCLWVFESFSGEYSI